MRIPWTIPSIPQDCGTGRDTGIWRYTWGWDVRIPWTVPYEYIYHIVLSHKVCWLKDLLMTWVSHTGPTVKKSPCLFETKLTQWILLARWALDRISWCGKSFMVIPKETLKCIAYRKSYSSQFRAYLAGSTEWVSSQTSQSLLCKLISPSTMGLYGSPYDCHLRTTTCYLTRIADY